MFNTVVSVEGSLPALETLRAPPVHPSFPPPLATTDPHCLRSVAFPRTLHSWNHAESVAFSDWLLSLSNVHFRLLCVFSWLESSFLLISESSLTIWVYHSLFIHSLKDIFVAFSSSLFEILLIVDFLKTISLKVYLDY